MKRSKSYQNADEKIDHDALYSPVDAVELAKNTTVTKFDPTVEVNLRLGVDPRKQDQMVRGTVNLPNGTGKTARVLTGRRQGTIPGPTSWAPTTCSSGSRAGSSTSTRWSPPRT
jgi:hypothetical protein